MDAAPHDPIAEHAGDTGSRHGTEIGGIAPDPVPAWQSAARLEPWLQRALSAAAEAQPAASSAAEWLLDNGYQVQRAIILVVQDLPPGFYQRLRRLDRGPCAGEPRVLALAHDMLEATHFQLAREAVLSYLQGYQSADALDIGELWALPALLRIACLERLVSCFAQVFPEVPAPFAVSRSCSCRSHGPEPTDCVSRSIANLAIVSSISWEDIFDASSSVEAVLARDPSRTYAAMDFETRDTYRKAVETLSRSSGKRETDVAEQAIALAQRCQRPPDSHVGHWLVGRSRPALELAIGASPPSAQRLGRRLLRRPGLVYTAGLFLCGLAGLIPPAAYLYANGADLLQWIVGMVLSTLPATVLSVTVVNWLVTLSVAPTRLPKLDFERGIAADWPTAVVVPVILSGVGEIPALMARLEAHRLSNPGARAIVLLSDPSDAASKRVEADEAIEAALADAIERLNRRYRHAEESTSFCLLHRTRRYNPGHDLWMAWERKRGKLEEFNHFLLTGDRSAFPLATGPIERLRGTRLVVTADADTRLPPGSVARLAGTLAHPLNRPLFDESGRVVSGYTVLQPRVELAPHGPESLFARLFGGDTAIDIYSRAVSDVYQDLVGTGNYVGKGIYDVAGFVRSLEGRIPENALLSHDLWEGLHGRAGLASDIIVYESFPATYAEYARRWHRWVRGDWQLFPWLFPRVPGPGGTRLRNRLRLFDRLRIWDTMRRSLVPPSVLALILAGWLVLPGQAAVWTVLALVVLAASLFTDLVSGLARGRRRGVLVGTMRTAAESASRWVLQIVFLVADTRIVLHAIGITLLRLRRRRRLLEWTSAAQVGHDLARASPRAAQWRVTAVSPLLALATAPALLLLRPEALPAAAPLLLAWLFAPEIAWLTGRTRIRPAEPLDVEDKAFLRRLARRTWYFFERFAGPEDNWLPPDNYQEAPAEQIAHRTSPTNIGMLALSMTAAWRLGYIGPLELQERLQMMFGSLDRLDRWHGHIYNWYDTTTLAPLEPRYVSTVDSGNLAVSLVVVAEACRRARAMPVISPWRWSGLDDNLALVGEALGKEADGREASIRAALERLQRTLCQAADIHLQWPAALDDALADLAEIRTNIAQSLDEGPDATIDVGELRDWLERSEHAVRDSRREIEDFLPWLRACSTAPANLAALAEELCASLSPQRPLEDCGAMHDEVCRLAAERTKTLAGDERVWLRRTVSQARRALARWRRLQRELERTACRAEAEAQAMDFAPLFNGDRKLFHIGYDVSAERIDQHFYDLMASEARLASYFAIAKRDVPPEHWFHLGRPIVKRRGELALVSWNGSMFEYLMPSLFLRSDPSTLLGESERSSVSSQRRYARSRGVPWGISESGFAAVGADGSWRYRAFGVPELGLRRGLAEDLVIAPYATALALPVAPHHATRNLRRLAGMGGLGRFGLFEALDFTPTRMSGEGPAMVRSFMAHHQGMSLAAIANALCAEALVEWFHADPRVRTIDLLLNERVPWELTPELERLDELSKPSGPAAGSVQLHPWRPELLGGEAVHVLGNGRLRAVCHVSGAGELGWNELAVTRPPSRDGDTGHTFWLTDRDTGTKWSPGGTPPEDAPDRRVLCHAHKLEIRRRIAETSTSLEVLISPSEDVEIRRLRLVNLSSRPRRIQFSSLCEIALAPRADWLRHPAFERLFVEAETHPTISTLLFARRMREPAILAPAAAMRFVASGDHVRLTGWEVSRPTCLGRLAAPHAPPQFSGAVGPRERHPLDTAAAFRAELDLGPDGEAELAIVTSLGPSRADALELARRYASIGSLDWAESDARMRAGREVQALGLPPSALSDAQLLLTALNVAAPRVAQTPAECRRDHLWSLGISGDDPILLLEPDEEYAPGQLQTVLAAHRMWRGQGVAVDLVIAHAGLPGYVEPVREQLLDVIREAGSEDLLGARGGIALVSRDRVDALALEALRAAAGAVLNLRGGPIRRQIAARRLGTMPAPPFVATIRGAEPVPSAAPPTAPPDRTGFGEAGDYCIVLGPEETTPALWANVLANERFGTIVSEAGLGFTFAANSGENRLTPWHNDPLVDPQGEALYLRDEETGQIWTVTPRPSGPAGPCEIEHGIARTRWSRRFWGLDQSLECFVDAADPVKVVRLQLRDTEARSRRLTATYFADWLLGAIASEPAGLRHSRYRADLEAVVAHNGWNADFAGNVAYLAATVGPHSITTSRREFLGAPADWARPAGLVAWDLGDRIDNQGADAAAGLQVHLDLPANGTVSVDFLLGQVQHEDDLAEAIAKWRHPDAAEGRLAETRDRWNTRLAVFEVKTPDRAFDLLVNRWLPYQSIASRIHARAGYYQASGAFGFRDQLQDVLAWLLAEPGLAREQILLAAAHQFAEGDVLHWWHPPSGKGVRTRCSDDLLWLPHAVARYVGATGDNTILGERVSFLDGPELRADQHDRYGTFAAGHEASVYDHCQRAFARAWRLGAHGLPLMGDGDWNDGMNRVGEEGRGESLWLGWFLVHTIRAFAAVGDAAQRRSFSAEWLPRAEALLVAIDRHGWDGGWYVRAFDDYGRPWGSSECEECRIDSLAQSWAVIAGGGEADRARRAIDSAFEHLVRKGDRLVRLLDPPFDATGRDPGYIKAYPPGIRENGGQYSHAAAWLGIAAAMLGDGARAKEVFDRLNPAVQSAPENAAYGIEPYVVAGDIAGGAEHTGRGGWSWYTGAAAWSWRLATEHILGITLERGKIRLAPCLPPDWPGYEATLRTSKGEMHIVVERGGVGQLRLDGRGHSGAIAFPGAGRIRKVTLTLATELSPTATRVAEEG